MDALQDAFSEKVHVSQNNFMSDASTHKAKERRPPARQMSRRRQTLDVAQESEYIGPPREQIKFEKDNRGFSAPGEPGVVTMEDLADERTNLRSSQGSRHFPYSIQLRKGPYTGLDDNEKMEFYATRASQRTEELENGRQKSSSGTRDPANGAAGSAGGNVDKLDATKHMRRTSIDVADVRSSGTAPAPYRTHVRGSESHQLQSGFAAGSGRTKHSRVKTTTALDLNEGLRDPWWTTEDGSDVSDISDSLEDDGRRSKRIAEFDRRGGVEERPAERSGSMTSKDVREEWGDRPGGYDRQKERDFETNVGGGVGSKRIARIASATVDRYASHSHVQPSAGKHKPKQSIGQGDNAPKESAKARVLSAGKRGEGVQLSRPGRITSADRLKQMERAYGMKPRVSSLPARSHGAVSSEHMLGASAPASTGGTGVAGATGAT
eukprot:Rmarinus@m.22385